MARRAANTIGQPRVDHCLTRIPGPGFVLFSSLFLIGHYSLPPLKLFFSQGNID